MMMINVFATDDDDVYYYIGERLKLERGRRRIWAFERRSGKA